MELACPPCSLSSLTVLPPHLADRPRRRGNNPGRSFISLANHLSGSSGLDWSPHRGYLLASGDRLIVLATGKDLSPFLAVH